MGLFSKKKGNTSATDIFLRIESAAIFAGVLILYFWLYQMAMIPWTLFLLFAALPEAAWLSYIQRKPESWFPNIIYNTVHMYATPIFLLVILWPYQPIYLLGWIANIALGRLIGLGFHSPRKESA